VKVVIDGEFDARDVLGFKVDSRTELEFPDVFQVGVRYLATPRLALEFDVDRTNWSTFDEILVTSRDAVPALGISPGSELASTTNNWRDSNSYHVAMTYDIDDRTQLRAGYTLNENMQRESWFSPRYPNSARHLLSAGVKRTFGGWDLEGAVMYGRWNDRKVDNERPFAGGDANGTSAYNGKYEIYGFLFGLGASLHF
jgi:long-chain fatty acid transport protein